MPLVEDGTDQLPFVSRIRFRAAFTLLARLSSAVISASGVSLSARISFALASTVLALASRSPAASRSSSGRLPMAVSAVPIAVSRPSMSPWDGSAMFPNSAVAAVCAAVMAVSAAVRAAMIPSAVSLSAKHSSPTA